VSDTIVSPSGGDAASPPPPQPQPLPAPKRRGRLRRGLIRLGCVAAFLVVAWTAGTWGWGKYEERALARRVDALRAAGEPVTPDDLAPGPVPDAANAAAAFRAAARTIDEKSAAWVVLEEQFEWPRPPLTDYERSTLRAVVGENAEALRLAEPAAAMAGADWGVTLTSPMILALVPDLAEQRKLARLIHADVMLALDAGDVGHGLRGVERLLAISRALEHHPTFIAHLVAAGVSALAAQTAAEAARDVMPGEPLTPEVLARAQALVARLLDEREFREGLLRAYRWERASHLDTLPAVLDGRMDAATQRGGGAGKVIPPGLMRALFVRNTSAALDHTGGLLDAAATTQDWPGLRHRLASSPSAVERSPRFYFLAHLLTASLDRAAFQHYRVAADRRMAAVVLAVALYRADHGGRLPATLGELVPDYLSAVPADPLAGGGKPLGYVPDPARPRVYSVGEDGVDHGGRPVDPRQSRSSQERVTDTVFDLERQPREAGAGEGPTSAPDAPPAGDAPDQPEAGE
jgi:hypothetical protein